MKLKKLYRSKKGLSTVISTILMIMVVMVGMSVAFAAVVEYSDSYKAGIGSSIMESITIEDIYLQGSNTNGYSNLATIWVYNSGQIDATVNAVYINGVAANATSTFHSIYVQIGQHVPIIVQAPSNWITGTKYDFKITTLRGSHFNETIIAT